MTTSRVSPVHLLVASFLALIVLGAATLLLPASTHSAEALAPIDALFTATSAVCVTGLVVLDTGSDFTLFGQIVILGLIQLGGIGVMTFSSLLLSAIAGRLSLTSRAVLTETLAGAGIWEDLWPLLRLVVGFTLLAEAAGATVLFVYWLPSMGVATALWASVFHAVSAFCNAGFSLWPTSLEAFRDDVVVNSVLSLLIVLGGLGFLVVHELSTQRRRRLSLHTRLVLTVSTVLILAGAAFFWVLERGDSLAGLGALQQIQVSLFQSVTARTAGFDTVPMASLTPGAQFLLIMLMFIGGSPGSCSGGIKTTTIGILALAAWSRVRNRQNTNVFRRTISRRTVQNAQTIATAGVALSMLALFGLLLLETPHAASGDPHSVFISYMFETISALGTVGLSTGLTPLLSPLARLLVALLMFVGRLGPVTVAAALSRDEPLDDWQYAEEEVMVG